MSTQYEPADDEVLEMVRDILKKFESHHPLIEAQVTIDVLMAYAEKDEETGEPTGPALMLNGYSAQAIAKIVGYKERVKGCKDAEIRIDGDWWNDHPGYEERCGLIDHELNHFAVRVKDGAIVHDVAGRPKLRMRKHDVQIGWFKIIAERHGNYSQERIQARAIMDRSGQSFWPDLCGEPGGDDAGKLLEIIRESGATLKARNS